MRPGTLSLLVEQHTLPRTQRGTQHMMALSSKIFAELMEITFQLNGRGGPMSEVHEWNQARGHSSKQFSSTCMLIYSYKGKRLECARQKQMANMSGRCESFHLYPHIFGCSTDPLIMIHLSEKCFVLWLRSHTCQCVNDIYWMPTETVNCSAVWSSYSSKPVLKGTIVHADQGGEDSKVRGRAIQRRLAGDLMMPVFQRAHVTVGTRAAGHLLASSPWGPPPPLPGSNIKNTETFPSNFYMKNLIIYTRN